MREPSDLRDSLRFLCDRVVGGRATIAALALTGALAAADLMLTVHVATTHGLLEVNPIARMLAAGLGVPGLVGFKLLTLAAGLGVLAGARRLRLARAAAIGVLAAHCWMMGQWAGYMDAMRDVHDHGVSITHTEHRLAMRL